jgi:hypothetical protein
MKDDSGTHKLKIEDLKSMQNVQPNDQGFSKDEIDSIADLIGDSNPEANVDLDETGRFQR